MTRPLTELIRDLSRLVVQEKINTDPLRLFWYIRLPEKVKQELTRLGTKLVGADKAEENDHLTLLYQKALPETLTPEAHQDVLEAARKIALTSPKLKATLQGFAYFDGAQDRDDKPATALVGLVDVPGLADIHVRLKMELARLGLDTTQKHGFTPHATFCYGPMGMRVPKLPLLKIDFDITEFELSNDQTYRFPLGPIGSD